MSYFNNKAQRPQQNKQQSFQQRKPIQNNNNKQYQQNQQMKQEPQEENLLGFAQDEVVFIENVLVKLQDMIPNDQGENSEILEMILTALQIIGARLDETAGFLGDSS